MNNIVKEDMICPKTNLHCDDECCTVGSVCNLDNEQFISPIKQNRIMETTTEAHKAWLEFQKDNNVDKDGFISGFCIAKELYDDSDITKNIISKTESLLNWINVEDRLPEVSIPCPKNKDEEKLMNKVLAYSPSTVGQTTAYFWGPSDDPMKGWSLMGVTHWKPLSDNP